MENIATSPENDAREQRRQQRAFVKRMRSAGHRDKNYIDFLFYCSEGNLARIRNLCHGSHICRNDYVSNSGYYALELAAPHYSVLQFLHDYPIIQPLYEQDNFLQENRYISIFSKAIDAQSVKSVQYLLIQNQNDAARLEKMAQIMNRLKNWDIKDLKALFSLPFLLQYPTIFRILWHHVPQNLKTGELEKHYQRMLGISVIRAPAPQP